MKRRNVYEIAIEQNEILTSKVKQAERRIRKLDEREDYPWEKIWWAKPQLPQNEVHHPEITL